MRVVQANSTAVCIGACTSETMFACKAFTWDSASTVCYLHDAVAVNVPVSSSSTFHLYELVCDNSKWECKSVSEVLVLFIFSNDIQHYC